MCSPKPPLEVMASISYMRKITGLIPHPNIITTKRLTKTKRKLCKMNTKPVFSQR